MIESKIIADIINKIALGYNPEKIFLFGSYAKGTPSEDSDIDLLVKFKETPSLLQLIKIENDLSSILGFKVDLVTEGSIKDKRIKTQIEQDLKIIYNA